MKTAVIGIGYVGLPLVVRLSQINYSVVGLDININKVRSLQKGQLPFAKDEPNLNQFYKKEFKKGKITFSNDFALLKDKDLIFLNVDTPIIGKSANYKSLIAACKSISSYLRNEAIVVVESTVSPGTTNSNGIRLMTRVPNSRNDRDGQFRTIRAM